MVARLSGGHYCGFRLRTLLASNDQQGNSSDQSQPADNGWNRNSLMIFPGGMDGPEIKNPLLMGIRESLIGEGQPAQNNQ
jgi:hypothetical protein